MYWVVMHGGRLDMITENQDLAADRRQMLVKRLKGTRKSARMYVEPFIWRVPDEFEDPATAFTPLVGEHVGVHENHSHWGKNHNYWCFRGSFFAGKQFLVKLTVGRSCLRPSLFPWEEINYSPIGEKARCWKLIQQLRRLRPGEWRPDSRRTGIDGMRSLADVLNS
jgi:hypothetical protein